MNDYQQGTLFGFVGATVVQSVICAIAFENLIKPRVHVNDARDEARLQKLHERNVL